MNFKVTTPEQYDKVIELMALPPEEVFDRSWQDQIGPFSQQAGITEQPEMTYREDVSSLVPNLSKMQALRAPVLEKTPCFQGF